MRHPIDPKIDCVFNALLGSETNRALLIHFLNATLGQDLAAPLTAVDILTPTTSASFSTTNSASSMSRPAIRPISPAAPPHRSSPPVVKSASDTQPPSSSR
jgi:hypothetical protein